MSLKVELYFWSRNYRLLFLLAALILAVGFGIASRKSGERVAPETETWVPAKIRELTDPWQALKDALSAADPALSETDRADRIVFLLIAFNARADKKATSDYGARVKELIAGSTLSPARKQLFGAFWKSLGSISGEPDAVLLTLAYRQQLTTANYLTAWLYMRQKNTDRALFFLNREGTFPKSADARRIEISILLQTKNFDALEKISKDPHYAKEWNLHADTEVAVHRHEWGRAAWNLLRLQLTGMQTPVAGLVLISGAVWFAIWLQAIQMLEAPLFRASCCLVAFVLGVFSVTPTLLLVYWSERHLGLVEGKGLLGDILFFCAGVGPREELCKLLAFLPLVPWLLQRGNRLEMLIVAGFAGLGFAVAENIQYFDRHIDAAYARFLTANFLHVAATGLVGLSLCETLLNPLRKWWVFPVCFLWISVLHGAYDVFLSSPLLTSVQGLSGACFIWLALVFFKRLRQARSLETNYFWMPGSITLGLAVVTAATLVYTAEAMGLTEAVTTLAFQAISFAMLIYLFVWQTGNLRYDADL